MCSVGIRETYRVSSSDFSRYVRTRSTLTSAGPYCDVFRGVRRTFRSGPCPVLGGGHDEEIPYPTGGIDRSTDAVGIPYGCARITEKTAYHTAIGFRTAITSFRRRTSAVDFPRTCASGRVLLTRSAGVARANVPPWERNFESFTPVVSFVFILTPPPLPWSYAMFVANFG